MVKEFLKTKHHINVDGNLIDLSVPKVMGILNITPDSFYDGGRFNNSTAIEEQVQKMVDEGVDIIDVGGYSTRPGAKDISESEEIERVLPVISSIKNKFPQVPISIDTFRSNVAEKALDEGAGIVNDVSGGELDPEMMDFVGEKEVPYIVMHMRGDPQTMSSLNKYENIVNDLVNYFQKKVITANLKGITDLILDPGIGFAKSIQQNYEILSNLDSFKVLERPLLIGLSRKSLIWKTLKIEPSEALNGTTTLNTIALLKGAGILRVHDIKEAKQVIALVNLINEK